MVASAMFLQEPMTLMAYTGSALILMGVFIANRNVKEHRLQH
jgi:drug/metabolite transporter (DMT)-like permease